MINFLYKTIIGRLILKGLVNPKVSKAGALFFSSPLSKPLINLFIRKNHIDMSLFEVPEGGYKSFNDFFTRKMKPEYMNNAHGIMISPCDALLTVSPVNSDLVFNIKNTQYSINELLGDAELAQEFLGGMAFIFRLTPAHYHRYAFAASGKITAYKRIEGILHSVRPICHEKCKVFIQNSREYVAIDNESIGAVVQMEIGALLVGKISNNNVKDGQTVAYGQEKGYFEYGGSSIVVLTGYPVELPAAIKNRPTVCDEIPIKIGERLI